MPNVVTISYRGRFAPSPTGPLHLGSLVAAVGSWARARSQRGAWIVRMEDLDPPREVPGAADDILRTLAAFGMESDESVMYQSRRNDDYRYAFDALKSHDDLFPCWCSRTELEIFNGIHPEHCIAPPDASREPAWRMRVPRESIDFLDLNQGPQRQDLRDDVGDFVVLRTEGWFAYQLAVVVDDAQQRISEIVRGADLLDSTPRQIYLQRRLGYPTPRYLHMPLVLDGDGRKLSKQDRARPVDRADPIAALRMALEFLGIETGGVLPQIDRLLAAAVTQFDGANVRFIDNDC